MCAFVGPASLPRPLYDAVLPGGSVFPGWRLAALLLLLAQQVDLSGAIEELIGDIEAGRKYMKTYKQMKMYNDPALNPVLYGQKK